MSDPVRFPPGSVLAEKYVVERQIASGGMGVVLSAVHRKLGHRLAIKVLHDRFAGGGPTRERFEREARMAALLRSEHVVRIHDVEVTEEGLPFIVMEFLAGEDLGSVVKRGPVPVRRAIDWILQACDALSEAHGLGIVHRDLKPENLFLARRSGRSSLKVVDFGISKVATSNPTALTSANERFGTPVYMAPEQLQSSADVDARTDVWALGVVLFELVSGARPFAGSELPELVANILTQPPRPLGEVLPGASPGLEAIVARCLAWDRADRPQSVDELADMLAAELEEPAHAHADARASSTSITEKARTTPDPAWVPPPVVTTPAPPARGPRRLGLRAVAGIALALGILATLAISTAMKHHADVEPVTGGLVAAPMAIDPPPPPVEPPPLPVLATSEPQPEPSAVPSGASSPSPRRAVVRAKAARRGSESL